jgi:hypothetical protein
LLVTGLLGCLTVLEAAPSSSPRFEGWQDQARQWGPVLQAANASYGEDRVVPVRWVGSLRAGTTHTLALKYDFSRGGRGVFLDALASFDATEGGVVLEQGIVVSDPLMPWPLPRASRRRAASPPPAFGTCGLALTRKSTGCAASR